MPLIVWDQSYAVNVKRCDEQHQKLFSLLNGLHQAMSVGQGRAILAPLVQELDAYTDTHFKAEETLMEQTTYPALAAHRGQHQTFIAQVQKFKQSLATEAGAPTVEVASFLMDWLSKHIKQTDRQYSSHLNAKGIH
jgi:hemerythrin-like metal-binding protein